MPAVTVSTAARSTVNFMVTEEKWGRCRGDVGVEGEVRVCWSVIEGEHTATVYIRLDLLFEDSHLAFPGKTCLLCASANIHDGEAWRARK